MIINSIKNLLRLPKRTGFVLCACLLLYSMPVWAQIQFNMHRGVTPLSQDIYWLHMTIFWICVGIGIIVFGALIYALINHRKSVGAKASVFHEHPVLEITWTIIPFVILVAMAIPATVVLVKMDDTQAADVTIKVVGHQWKWEYQYLDENISFFSNLSTPPSQMRNQQQKNEWYLLEVDKPLVLPVDKKVRFLVTANDVIHSWWVPELGIKRDAIPGFIYEAWARIEEPGTYRGQCAELCGVFHGYMPIVVEAVSEDEYLKWVANQRPTKGEAATEQEIEEEKVWTVQELMAFGEDQYLRYCAACHQSNGAGIPPLFPALRASSVVVGAPISRHIDIVLNGVPGSAMQGFGGQLNDAELAAIITYERNAWGNNTGDVIQPEDVKAQR